MPPIQGRWLVHGLHYRQLLERRTVNPASVTGGALVGTGRPRAAGPEYLSFQEKEV